ncbi:MAG TPA: thermonuclease family protein [Sphingomicrobium sp.]|nr:thermonuclease family protein [Sphingomicrobium sp.]
MATKRFKPNRRPPSFRPGRRDIRLALWAIPLLVLAGALFDPKLFGPVGPLGAAPERVSTTFTMCGAGGGPACVVDGDTFRLGERRIRVMGIDAPELAQPRCELEAALARRSADRLRDLLNQGPFEMVAHRLQRQDRHEREVMMLRRGGESIGSQLIDEGLAHRYTGFKRRWC